MPSPYISLRDSQIIERTFQLFSGSEIFEGANIGHEVGVAIFDESLRGLSLEKNRFVPQIRNQFPFESFIARETHYAFERAGKRWDEQRNQFEKVTPAEYNALRTKVVAAIAHRAFDFWSHSHPPESRLTCDLQPYLYAIDLFNWKAHHALS